MLFLAQDVVGIITRMFRSPTHIIEMYHSDILSGEEFQVKGLTQSHDESHVRSGKHAVTILWCDTYTLTERAVHSTLEIDERMGHRATSTREEAGYYAEVTATT